METYPSPIEGPFFQVGQLIDLLKLMGEPTYLLLGVNGVKSITRLHAPGDIVVTITVERSEP